MSMAPGALGARFSGLTPLMPRLKKIWADAAYRGQDLAAWCPRRGGVGVGSGGTHAGTRGFSIQPRRWVVERSFSWLVRNRRLRVDYERKVQTSETLIQVGMIRLLLARLGRKHSPVPKHPMSPPSVGNSHSHPGMDTCFDTYCLSVSARLNSTKPMSSSHERTP